MFNFFFIYLSFLFVSARSIVITPSYIASEPLCEAPGIIMYGTYSVSGIPYKNIPRAYKECTITVTCTEGFVLYGEQVANCKNGKWSSEVATCELPCTLKEDKSVKFYCLNNTELVPCNKNLLRGTEIFPVCKENYKYKDEIRKMTCNHYGYFDHGVICVPDSNVTGQGSNISSSTNIVPNIAVSEPLCEAPNGIMYGSYSVVGIPYKDVPRAYEECTITVTCTEGFVLYGEQVINCKNGKWSSEVATCELSCTLKEDKSVYFYCLNNTELVPCNKNLLRGTEIFPICKENYKYEGEIRKMTCSHYGFFDHGVICVPDSNVTAECGVSSVNLPLISMGFNAAPGEVPWHAGVYTKSTKPYMLLCGGSIVTSSYVISAAHCFWYDDRKMDSSQYAVAVGKTHRSWSALSDIHAQYFDVADVHLPMLFFDSLANYQNDIALVKLATVIEFNRFVKPVCLEFSEDLNNGQLQDGNFGKVSGWGFMNMEGDPPNLLKTTFLPYISLSKCANESSYSFKSYLNYDKICAGYTNGTAVCKGDSGGGLVFHKTIDGVTRYYLQGIVSIAPVHNVMKCNVYSWAIFTHVYAHRNFIKLYLK
ncbi:hypothetical protein K1T71_014474 [Dendrolimus kikuchii]|uniref:Uncharacterized protein n=1 Tax=Dendrolimus kikuchii TaxID=765133 RepID=A0ACC1CE74_9NEOP|nr:hypothetical protein K1T71_014474 [Dendrolimus kikuchii]